MARISVEPGLEVNCEVADYLWPWDQPTPVLMQHGFSRNAGFWRRVVPPVCDTRRVYRPDVRGCGKSDAPASDFRYSTDLLVRDALTVMDALGLERVHWLGESSGGVLGVLLASQHPERIASLTLVNTPIRVKVIAATYAFDQESTSAAILKYGVAEWCRKSLSHRLDLDIAGPELENFFITEMGKTPDHVAAAIHEVIEEVNTFPLLRTLSVPVLLLSGDKKRTTYDMQREMEREIPDVELKVFEGLGNALAAIAPDRIATEALAFWDRIEARVPVSS